MQEALTEQQQETTEYRVVGPPGCGKTTWLGSQVGADQQVTACPGRRPAADLALVAAAATSGRPSLKSPERQF